MSGQLEQIAAMQELIDQLEAHGGGAAATEEIRSSIARLRENMERLDAAVAERHDIAARLEARVEEARRTHRDLLETLEPMISDAELALIMGTGTASRESAKAMNAVLEEGVGQFRSLLSLRADATRVYGLLIEARTVNMADRLRLLEGQIEKPVSRIREALPAIPDDDAGEEVREALEGLISRVEGGDGVPQLRRAILEEADSAAEWAMRELLHHASNEHRSVLNGLTPLVEQANRDMVRQLDAVGAENASRISDLVDTEMASLQGYLEIRSSANRAAGVLASAGNVDDQGMIRLLRNEFLSEADVLRAGLTDLSDDEPSRKVAELADGMVELGERQGNIFGLRREVLEASRAAQDVLSETREVSEALARDVAEMTAQAGELGELSQSLQRDVQTFLEHVRAA